MKVKNVKIPHWSWRNCFGLPSEQKRIESALESFVKNQKPLDPDIQQIVNENFWELITKTKEKELRPITVAELIEDLNHYASLPDNDGINPQMYVVIEKDRLLFQFPCKHRWRGLHNGGLRMTKEIEEK
jgi:hypothetical protein